VSAYLDASVVVPRLVEEPYTGDVEAYLAGNPDEFFVSDFAAAEVASALSRLVRIRRLSTADASSALNDFDIWRATSCFSVDVRAADARLAYAYVRRFELMLRAPDALHLAIARRLGATLVTLDGRLADAGRELAVSVAVPGRDSHRDEG
jgi:predicted nucleic acid-binding protein